MINDKRVLAIIAARGGSKGLPGKNTMQLNGKPLIAWTIEQALKTKEIDAVVVTTDCPDIAGISKEYGAQVPFLRPSELASDFATSFSAVEHCIEYYSKELGLEYDVIALLEPTSPLRDEGDISNMLVILDKNFDRCSAVIGVGEVSEHPSIAKNISDSGYLTEFVVDEVKTTRRQDNPKVYFPYGHFLIKTTVLLEEKSFYPKDSLPYKLKRFQCYEIDDIYDFLAIENIMKYEWRLS